MGLGHLRTDAEIASIAWSIQSIIFSAEKSGMGTEERMQASAALIEKLSEMELHAHVCTGSYRGETERSFWVEASGEPLPLTDLTRLALLNQQESILLLDHWDQAFLLHLQPLEAGDRMRLEPLGTWTEVTDVSGLGNYTYCHVNKKYYIASDT